MDISITTVEDVVDDAPEPGCTGACACGATRDETPVLDVRTIPASIRHAGVLGAVGAVGPSTSLVLVAPHDPLPLLREIDDRYPGTFDVSYDARGPETWQVRLTRLG